MDEEGDSSAGGPGAVKEEPAVSLAADVAPPAGPAWPATASGFLNRASALVTAAEGVALLLGLGPLTCPAPAPAERVEEGTEGLDVDDVWPDMDAAGLDEGDMSEGRWPRPG